MVNGEHNAIRESDSMVMVRLETMCALTGDGLEELRFADPAAEPDFLSTDKAAELGAFVEFLLHLRETEVLRIEGFALFLDSLSLP
jgi:hypothetical protein